MWKIVVQIVTQLLSTVDKRQNNTKIIEKDAKIIEKDAEVSLYGH